MWRLSARGGKNQCRRDMERKTAKVGVKVIERVGESQGGNVKQWLKK